VNPERHPLHEITSHLPRVNETLRTRYWNFTLFTSDDGPTSLVELLKTRLPHIPTDSWPERFNFGGVYVNGHEALGEQNLPLPCRVEYYEPKFEISRAAELFPPFNEDYVIFSDHHIVVAYKPNQLSSMPAKEQRHYSLKASLEKIFKCHIHMPSRLDVSAQGLVVVSISPEAHQGLQRAFETRTAHKTYRLATDRPFDWTTRTATANIARHQEHPVLRTASYLEGQTAETLFSRSHTTLSDDTSCSVITAHPVTGRTHQIRVHAASFGIPILGDNFYGGTAAPYLHLVSVELSIPHPVSGKALHFSLPASLAPSWALSGD
jgi:tRNA pseudouridine32 synthase/23S rRNA pseudouridine746 synthase